MSVSDPLLKRLKTYVLLFRTEDKTVDDHHNNLAPFCEVLELVLRKGLSQKNSIFGVTRNDVWTAIDNICKPYKCDPKLVITADKVRNCKKTHSVRGRGRLFLRIILTNRNILSAIKTLIVQNKQSSYEWYDEEISIIGNEILSEIFLSLLYQVQEIDFQFDLGNASFLDQTWVMPVYRRYEFVPCKDLGIQVQFVDGWPIVIAITDEGVAAEDNKVDVGDILEELLGEPTHGVKLNKMGKMLKANQGYPVFAAVVKCRLKDHSIYPPIENLLYKSDVEDSVLKTLLKEEQKRKEKLLEEKNETKKPPHALLPEDERDDELPVHSNEGAVYTAKYCGSVAIGVYGGVDQIEHAVGKVLKHLEENKQEMQSVVVELGEKDVIITDRTTRKTVMTHSYTEISSCGRRTDAVQYFSYIAGETTCTLAKKFVAHVFLANDENDCKTILCSIAQGFNRTHWFV